MSTFQQRVTFTGRTPEELYAIYLDSERHAMALRAEAWIEPKLGGRFEIFGKGTKDSWTKMLGALERTLTA